MFKKLVKISIAAALIASPLASSLAFAKGTEAEAKAMLSKAVAFIKANGKDKSLAAFSNAKGEFVKDDIYVFTYENCVVTSHGANPKLIGKNVCSIKDPDGKAFPQEIMNTAATSEKSIEYKWTSPTSGKIEKKIAFYVKVGDVVVITGSYKD